nr:unnamed protein product [Callosobruchus analis]
MRVVCYYTNWSVYRPGVAKFTPQNINPYLWVREIYRPKTYNKNLKTMLAIGGWNEGSARFSPMVASPERRKQLVRNAIKFLRQNHFDGLDLDWEYPAFRDGGKPRDKENYAALVQELREEFDRESEKTGRPRLLLTMAVPAGIEYINKGYDIPKLMKYLDWMNMLSYDFHSAYEPAVNHHAPLTTQYSITSSWGLIPVNWFWAFPPMGDLTPSIIQKPMISNHLLMVLELWENTPEKMDIWLTMRFANT